MKVWTYWCDWSTAQDGSEVELLVAMDDGTVAENNEAWEREKKLARDDRGLSVEACRVIELRVDGAEIQRAWQPPVVVASAPPSNRGDET